MSCIVKLQSPRGIRERTFGKTHCGISGNRICRTRQTSSRLLRALQASWPALFADEWVGYFCRLHLVVLADIPQISRMMGPNGKEAVASDCD